MLSGCIYIYLAFCYILYHSPDYDETLVSYLEHPREGLQVFFLRSCLGWGGGGYLQNLNSWKHFRMGGGGYPLTFPALSFEWHYNAWWVQLVSYRIICGGQDKCVYLKMYLIFVGKILERIIMLLQVFCFIQ